jgi:hypothetical protein
MVRVGGADAMSDAPTLRERLGAESQPEQPADIIGALQGASNDLEWGRALLGLEPRLPAYSPRDVLPAILGSSELPADEGAGRVDPVVTRILMADNLEDALRAQVTEPLEAVLQLPLYLSQPRWYPSEYWREGDEAGGAACFCVVEAVEQESGLVHTLTIGSQQAQAAIWRAWAEGKLPLSCRFIKSAKATRSGFFPYNIEAV